MTNKKKEIVLITGCSGRIGFRTAERLLPDYQILGVDVFLVGHLPGVELIGIDLASPRNLREHLDLIRKRFGNKIHSVIHLAAYYSFTKGHWAEYERITIQGTKHLLEQLKENFSVGQFIFSSSMLVHAPCPLGKKIREHSPILPTWNYPKSKVLTEELIREHHGSIPYVNLRIAGVYDDLCQSIPLSNQIKRIGENRFEGHLFAGNIQSGASFVHLEDVVDAIVLAVKKRDELPPALDLLIGEPVTLSYDTLQREFSKLIWGKEWKTVSIPKPIAKMGAYLMNYLPFCKIDFIQPWMIDRADDNYVLDISRAEKLLGWHPKRTLLSTIPKWIDMLKREPLAWYDMNRLKAPATLKAKEDE